MPIPTQRQGHLGMRALTVIPGESGTLGVTEIDDPTAPDR